MIKRPRAESTSHWLPNDFEQLISSWKNDRVINSATEMLVVRFLVAIPGYGLRESYRTKFRSIIDHKWPQKTCWKSSLNSTKCFFSFSHSSRFVPRCFYTICLPRRTSHLLWFSSLGLFSFRNCKFEHPHTPSVKEDCRIMLQTVARG